MSFGSGMGFVEIGKRVFGGGKGGGNGGPDLPKIPKFAMKKTEDFIKNEAAPMIGGADGASALSRRFGGMKERITNQANAAGRTQSDAIKRRFAAQGAVGSGAEMKMQQMADEQNLAQRNDALVNVEAMEAEAFMNRDLQQADMDFKQKVFNFERGSKMHELDLAERQQQQDAVATEINARVAKYQMQPPKQGLLSSALGGLL